MLVLSRKSGQRIQIGDDITVEIRRIAGNRVTIALEAPKSVRILRGELDDAAREFDDEFNGTDATAHNDSRSSTYQILQHPIALSDLGSGASCEMVG